MLERKYTVKEIRYDELKRNVSIPQFQRSLVWSNEQKKEFIRAVKEGNPFGSILVHQTMGKYEIIDGLQRFTTLKKYEENPSLYMDISTETYPKITEIANIIKHDLPNIQTEILEKRVIDCIKETLREVSISDWALTRKIRKRIVSPYGDAIITQTNDEIDDKIQSMVLTWQNEIDFRSLEIPTIIYTGDACDLPDIFEKLNTGGTKLSRYEVFASTWNSIKLKVDNNELLDYIEESYKKKCERTNLSISNYEEGLIKQSKEISLYELCFAFGKIIKDKCKILFATYSDTEEDQVDSIGFTALSTALDIPLKKLSNLNKKINEETNISNLMKLLDAIVWSFQQVEEVLKNYISTVDEKVFTKFIEAQILSISFTHFKLYNKVNDDLSISQVNTSRKLKEDFKRYMPYSYLYDIISEYWAGSGDRKLAEEMAKPIEENRHMCLILKTKWESLLTEWMGAQIIKKPKNVCIENKLFLNFICKTKLDWHNNLIKYDIEHIIPKKRISDKKLDVAVSAIGNLCLLPAIDNRAKKDETVYEYLDRKAEISNVNEEKIKNLYYPTRDELSFVRTGSGFNTDTYNRYLSDRNNYLIREFLKLVQ